MSTVVPKGASPFAPAGLNLPKAPIRPPAPQQIVTAAAAPQTLAKVNRPPTPSTTGAGAGPTPAAAQQWQVTLPDGTVRTFKTQADANAFVNSYNAQQQAQAQASQQWVLTLPDGTTKTFGSQADADAFSKAWPTSAAGQAYLASLVSTKTVQVQTPTSGSPATTTTYNVIGPDGTVYYSGTSIGAARAFVSEIFQSDGVRATIQTIPGHPAIPAGVTTSNVTQYSVTDPASGQTYLFNTKQQAIDFLSGKSFSFVTVSGQNFVADQTTTTPSSQKVVGYIVTGSDGTVQEFPTMAAAVQFKNILRADGVNATIKPDTTGVAGQTYQTSAVATELAQLQAYNATLATITPMFGVVQGAPIPIPVLNGYQVILPNGQVYTFPTQAAATNFVNMAFGPNANSLQIIQYQGPNGNTLTYASTSSTDISNFQAKLQAQAVSQAQTQTLNSISRVTTPQFTTGSKNADAIANAAQLSQSVMGTYKVNLGGTDYYFATLADAQAAVNSYYGGTSISLSQINGVSFTSSGSATSYLANNLQHIGSSYYLNVNGQVFQFQSLADAQAAISEIVNPPKFTGKTDTQLTAFQNAHGLYQVDTPSGTVTVVGQAAANALVSKYTAAPTGGAQYSISINVAGQTQTFTSSKSGQDAVQQAADYLNKNYVVIDKNGNIVLVTPNQSDTTSYYAVGSGYTVFSPGNLNASVGTQVQGPWPSQAAYQQAVAANPSLTFNPKGTSVAPIGTNYLPQLGVAGTFLTGVFRTPELFLRESANLAALVGPTKATNPILAFSESLGASALAFGGGLTSIVNPFAMSEVKVPAPFLLSEAAGVGVSLFATGGFAEFTTGKIATALGIKAAATAEATTLAGRIVAAARTGYGIVGIGGGLNIGLSAVLSGQIPTTPEQVLSEFQFGASFTAALAPAGAAIGGLAKVAGAGAESLSGRIGIGILGRAASASTFGLTNIGISYAGGAREQGSLLQSLELGAGLSFAGDLVGLAKGGYRVATRGLSALTGSISDVQAAEIAAATRERIMTTGYTDAELTYLRDFYPEKTVDALEKFQDVLNDPNATDRQIQKASDDLTVAIKETSPKAITRSPLPTTGTEAYAARMRAYLTGDITAFSKVGAREFEYLRGPTKPIGLGETAGVETEAIPEEVALARNIKAPTTSPMKAYTDRVRAYLQGDVAAFSKIKPGEFEYLKGPAKPFELGTTAEGEFEAIPEETALARNVKAPTTSPMKAYTDRVRAYLSGDIAAFSKVKAGEFEYLRGTKAKPIELGETAEGEFEAIPENIALARNVKAPTTSPMQAYVDRVRAYLNGDIAAFSKVKTGEFEYLRGPTKPIALGETAGVETEAIPEEMALARNIPAPKPTPSEAYLTRVRAYLGGDIEAFSKVKADEFFDLFVGKAKVPTAEEMVGQAAPKAELQPEYGKQMRLTQFESLREQYGKQTTLEEFGGATTKSFIDPWLRGEFKTEEPPFVKGMEKLLKSFGLYQMEAPIVPEAGKESAALEEKGAFATPGRSLYQMPERFKAQTEAGKGETAVKTGTQEAAIVKLEEPKEKVEEKPAEEAKPTEEIKPTTTTRIKEEPAVRMGYGFGAGLIPSLLGGQQPTLAQLARRRQALSAAYSYEYTTGTTTAQSLRSATATMQSFVLGVKQAQQVKQAQRVAQQQRYAFVQIPMQIPQFKFAVAQIPRMRTPQIPRPRVEEVPFFMPRYREAVTPKYPPYTKLRQQEPTQGYGPTRRPVKGVTPIGYGYGLLRHRISYNILADFGLAIGNYSRRQTGYGPSGIVTGAARAATRTVARPTAPRVPSVNLNAIDLVGLAKGRRTR